MIKIGLLIIALVSLNSLAAEDFNCYETAVTQSEINLCASSQQRSELEQLQRLTQVLYSRLPEQPQAQLVAGQKVWDKLVEHDCAITAWYLQEGSAQPMAVAGCYQQHARQRIQMLLPLLCHPMLSTCEARLDYENTRLD